MTKQQLIEDNMKLVHFTIKNYFPNCSFDEDIVQCGMVGLCKAAEVWDEQKGKFSTLATSCIRNEIFRELKQRNKHQGVYSLDYEYNLDDGEKVTVGDIQIGDEDVDYVDTDYIYKRLTAREAEIFDLKQFGLSSREIAEKFGVSKQYISQVIRKVRNIMEVHNGNN